MRDKIFFYAKKTIIFIIAVVSLLTLCFTCLSIKVNVLNTDNSSQILLSGFDFILKPLQKVVITNNYTMFISNDFSLTILIFSIILIVLSIFNFFIKSNQADFIVIIIALFLGDSINRVFSYLGNFDYMQEHSQFGYFVYTAVYIPLIIQAVLSCCYCVLLFLTKRVSNSNTYIRKKKVISTSSYIEDLKQLKELFDAQIITQEEFDAKKKEILDL